MTDPVEVGARAAAARLVADTGTKLPADVERALADRDKIQPPDQYLDPISLGALIVSVASLAWTIYKDLRKQTPSPSPEVIARTVRVQLEAPPQGLDSDQRDRIIDITVEETINASETA
jgi:hypothetical protein